MGYNEYHPTLQEHFIHKKKAQRQIGTCKICKKMPILIYEPGCLSAWCDCKTWKSHEEDRIELAAIIQRDLETMT